jgi:ferritin-like metal-binding protein YciE
MTTKTRFTNGGPASNGTKKTISAPVWTGKKNTTGKKKTLENLFETELLSIYSAEKQLLKSIPRWGKASDSEDLQDAFQNSYEQTTKQVERIEKIAERLGIDVTVTPVNEPMQSLIDVCDEITEVYEPGTVRDSALIVGTQKVEHFEIATYGSLRELAEVLGYHKIATLLDRSLHEEGQIEHILSQIAMDVNDEACQWAEKEKQGMFEYEYR